MISLYDGPKSPNPRDVLSWIWDACGDKAVATSSFQSQSLPLLHMISRACPGLPVLFVDTGFHFPETLAYRDEVRDRLNLNVITVSSQMPESDLTRMCGSNAFRQNPDCCCRVNKTEPLREALRGYEVWISGILAEQTPHRAHREAVEMGENGMLRVHPLLAWTRSRLMEYIERHALPSHPLAAAGYTSIGCAPCTAVGDETDERSGRWPGLDKTECGLHTELLDGAS